MNWHQAPKVYVLQDDKHRVRGAFSTQQLAVQRAYHIEWAGFNGACREVVWDHDFTASSVGTHDGKTVYFICREVIDDPLGR